VGFLLVVYDSSSSELPQSFPSRKPTFSERQLLQSTEFLDDSTSFILLTALKSSIMAAVIKAANAKIRANPTLSYFCSTRKSKSPA
jgi:hypothetical protein